MAAASALSTLQVAMPAAAVVGQYFLTAHSYSCQTDIENMELTLKEIKAKKKIKYKTILQEKLKKLRDVQ